MAKHEFRVIRLCQKLCLDIVEMQGTADMKYRYTICDDLRKMSEKALHLVRRANGMPAGQLDRIKLQDEAAELLEKIKDLLPIAGKAINSGVRREAQVELSIENVQKPLRNWIESELKNALSMCENRMKNAAWNLYYAKKTYELVNEYYKEYAEAKTAAALEQSKSRYRIAHNDYKILILEYDELMKRLLDVQERFHKDDSILGEVLKEIKKKTGKEVICYSGKSSPDPNVVAEKKQIVKNANMKIAKSERDNLSNVMIERLKS